MTPDEAATESSAGKDTVTDKNSVNTSSSPTGKAVLPEQAKNEFKCDYCDFESKSQRGLKTHIGHKHK